MIVDPGSVWDLAGSEWAKSVAQRAHSHGFTPSYDRRRTPLNISGVGNGSQQCTFDCQLPVALRTIHGSRRTGIMHAPTVTKSALPGLLGLNALKKNRAVLDVSTNRLYFLGPGDYDLEKAMPPGTDVIQCEEAPSGHIIMPCCEYDAPTTAEPQQSLTLHAREADRNEHTGAGSPEGVSHDRQPASVRIQPAVDSGYHYPNVPNPPSTAPQRVMCGTRPVPPPPQYEPHL